jgi:hypothetical protein
MRRRLMGIFFTALFAALFTVNFEVLAVVLMAVVRLRRDNKGLGLVRSIALLAEGLLLVLGGFLLSFWIHCVVRRCITFGWGEGSHLRKARIVWQ